MVDCRSASVVMADLYMRDAGAAPYGNDNLFDGKRQGAKNGDKEPDAGDKEPEEGEDDAGDKELDDAEAPSEVCWEKCYTPEHGLTLTMCSIELFNYREDSGLEVEGEPHSNSFRIRIQSHEHSTLSP